MRWFTSVVDCDGDQIVTVRCEDICSEQCRKYATKKTNMMIQHDPKLKALYNMIWYGFYDECFNLCMVKCQEQYSKG